MRKEKLGIDQTVAGHAIVHKGKHWLNILVSPLIISVVAAVMVAWGVGQSVHSWIWGACGGLAGIWVLLYLVSYTGLFRKPLNRAVDWLRARRFRRPRILVLDGTLRTGRPSTISPYATNRRPDDWCHDLRRRHSNWTIDAGPIQRLSEEPFDIVINPFGEVYPEEDPALHTTLRQLAGYVLKGGVYVNVAGYPFWWHHSPTTGETGVSGRWDLTIESGQLRRAELKPILSDSLLGISPDMGFGSQIVPTKQDDRERERFGEIAGEGGDNLVKVFRPYPDSLQAMIPMLRTTDTKRIVFGAVLYGRGAFLFFGMTIDDDTKGFEKALAAVEGWARYETRQRRA